MTRASISVLLALTMFSASIHAKVYTLTSPDSHISVTVTEGECVRYDVERDGVVLLKDASASMTLMDGRVFGAQTKASKVLRRSVDQTVSTVVYQKKVVRDRFNELTLRYKEYDVIFRAYDKGVAYRFVAHTKAPFKVQSEKADFAFAGDWNMFVPYVAQHLETLESQLFSSFENRYVHAPMSAWDKSRLAFLPLMVQGPGEVSMLVMEADLMDYPGMYLYNSDGDSTLEGRFARKPKDIHQGGHHMLQMIVDSREDFLSEYDRTQVSFPWRIVAIGENDAAVADNDLVYLLATPQDPSVDYSWVRPGKVAWDWWNDWNIIGVDFEAGINNDTYKYYIDFASKNGIEYVILDEGWAVNNEADLFQVIPEINLEELIAYGAQRNVGIILWAGYYAFERDMEKVCREYSKMGVKGFKVDFMDRDDCDMVDFHRRAAQMCSRYHMMVDFHGTYKPTGLHRTYPCVVNYEGIHGLEQMKWSPNTVDQVEYDVTVPFIRFSAGQADYTQGAMRNATRSTYHPVNSEPMSQGTRCRQLAEYVVFYSPLNMLCDSPSAYMKEPECTEYIASVPVEWDETRILCGKVASHIVTARRHGDDWYVGGLTSWEERDVTVDMSFLGEGKYKAVLYHDGPNAGKNAKDYVVEDLSVDASTTLKIHLAPGGGFALVLSR